MCDELILVDINDNTIGSGEKLQVHKDGKLHRAFSVFIVSDGKMLIQKRNINKYHSGGLWANACCSHPRVGETLDMAVPRRLKEELGIETPVKELFDFIYRTVFEDKLVEYEYDHVFLAEYAGDFKPSPEEIEELKWISYKELAKDLVNNPQNYSSWFTIAAPRVLKYLI